MDANFNLNNEQQVDERKTLSQWDDSQQSKLERVPRPAWAKREHACLNGGRKESRSQALGRAVTDLAEGILTPLVFETEETSEYGPEIRPKNIAEIRISEHWNEWKGPVGDHTP
jgi:hypothetical protein